MRSIDSDIKALNDQLTETKNNLGQLVKKEGTTLMSKDLSEVIHSATNLSTKDCFGDLNKSTFLTTLVVVLHKN